MMALKAHLVDWRKRRRCQWVFTFRVFETGVCIILCRCPRTDGEKAVWDYDEKKLSFKLFEDFEANCGRSNLSVRTYFASKISDVVQLISVQYVTERPVLHGAGVATIERVLVYFQPKEWAFSSWCIVIQTLTCMTNWVHPTFNEHMQGACYERVVGSGYKQIHRKFSETADIHVMLLVTTVNTKHICGKHLSSSSYSFQVYLNILDFTLNSPLIWDELP